MLRILYTLLSTLMLPWVLLRLRWRASGYPGQGRRWRERLGWIPQQPQATCWLHAVSVGEMGAAAPLVMALQQRHPQSRWLISTTTPTGAAHARQLFAQRVTQVYAPYDLPWVLKRYFARAQPKCLILMETELWPNWLRQAQALGVPVVLANARLSERSAKAYQRFPHSSRQMLKQLHWIGAQYPGDAKRFIALGANAAKVTIVGNLKFNRPIPENAHAQAKALLARVRDGRPVWVAASTHHGEEDQIIAAHKQILALLPNALLLIAPRHPERFQAVGKLLDHARLRWTSHRAGQRLGSDTQCLLLDQMGMLHGAYGASSVAFVGGSLVPHGGQNCLEPASMGTAIITGPHMHNFSHIQQLLGQAGACLTVSDASELATEVIKLFEQPAKARRMGKAALATLQSEQQALPLHLKAIEGLV